MRGPATPLLSALPDFGWAAVFLITWVDPTFFGPTTVRHLVMAMALEFLVIHSAAFMGAAVTADTSRLRRILVILALGALYSVFCWGFSVAFGSWWPMWAFWSLTLTRLMPLIVGRAPSDQEEALMGGTWVASVLFYLFGVFATAFAPVPPLGITPEVVAAQGMTVGGLWPEAPWYAMAFGFLYYTLQGLFMLVAPAVIARRARR